MTFLGIPEFGFLTGRVFIFTTPEEYAGVLRVLAGMDVSGFSGRSFISSGGAKVTVLSAPVEKSKEEWVGVGDYTLILRGVVEFNWLQEWVGGAKTIYTWGQDLQLVRVDEIDFAKRS